ncbi:MAG: immunoglobulin-like domain-containing protein [Candidatus Paceibacterota bacterium]|jgi:hypothetical protein
MATSSVIEVSGNPTVVADTSFTGSSIVWTNPNNATTSDNTYATLKMEDATYFSDYLRASNFGFSIPAGSTINGIKVNIEKKQACKVAGCSPSVVSDKYVKVFKGLSATSSNKAKTSEAWPTTDTIVTYGSETEKWGTTWTASDINSSNFGVGLSITRTAGGTRIASVDNISVTVYYTPDTTAPEITINEPGTTPAQSKTITASANEGTLKMSNTTGSVCDSSLTFISYTSQTFTSESDNGKKVCYRAIDSASNTTYKMSNAIGGIDQTAPTSSVTSPSSGSLVNGTITIEANASDTTADISKVEFWHSSVVGVKIGEDTNSPYSISFDTTSLTDGVHNIWVDAYDEAGNHALSASVSIDVDNTAPVLTLPTTITEEATSHNGAVAIFTATATDTNPATPTVNCTPESGSTFPVGSNDVECSATDTAGNTATNSFAVIITDTTLPTITAPVDQIFEATGPLTNPTLIQAVATDIADENPIISYTPTTFPLGETIVNWKATDHSGNISEEVTSLVTIEDTTGPIINIASSDSIDTWINEEFSEPTCAASDLVDGSPLPCEVTDNNVDTGALGTYHVTYKATDNQENSSEKTIEVNAVDKDKPIIYRTGYNVLDLEAGSIYMDEGATAEDKIGADISSLIVTTGLPIDTLVLGLHKIFYNVTDSWGTSANQAERSVIVVDTTAPVITLLGVNPMELIVGDTFIDPGATASDIVDSSIVVNASGVVDTNTAGSYTITYTATDSAGNVASPITRTVNVTETEIVPPTSTELVINEIDYDQPSADIAEFVELKNIGEGVINLDNYEVRLINGTGIVLYQTINLPSVNLNSGDYYIICSNTATVINCDLDISPNTDLIQNGGAGADAVAIFDSTNTIIDTVSYEGSVAGYTEGTGAQADLAPTDSTPHSISRYPDGQDTNNNSADFAYVCITPGSANTNGTNCEVVDDTPLPIDGVWSAWSPVNEQCGLIYTQTRICTEPTNGGIPCSAIDGGNSTRIITNDACQSTSSSGGGSSGSYIRPIPTITPILGQVLGAEKFIFTLPLKLGSKGNEVIELQKFLNTAGYNCGLADGIFGPKTKAAVMKFQLANGLDDDGIVGPLTREVLNR